MTKPKSAPRHRSVGAPPYPSLELYVEFEATRRLAGRSINAHSKSWSLQFVDGHMPAETWRLVKGEALRQHIQIFRRENIKNADPVMLDRFEKMIQTRMALVID